jgi:hypothetical protein
MYVGSDMYMKASDDYSLSLAGFQRQYMQATEHLRNKQWSAAFYLITRLEERLQHAKWYAKERMTESDKQTANEAWRTD